MARKPERYNAIAERKGTADADNTMVSTSTGKQYSVALYARLSVEKDGQKSDSIESQFMIMENFIKDKPELSQYQKYFDRGVSGTTFTRPDFVRMMDDVKGGRINCIIVKDLSRFVRDYLETGNYIETILPFLGVRFISVNDHFDTVEDCNGNKGLGISLMNLVNDMYAKDVSKRITTAFESCMERGSVLGSAPYGYDRIKNDSGYQLVIDEPAAEIVRRIFQMAKDGMSHRAIAGELTRSGVQTPEGYRQTGLVSFLECEPLSEWKNGTISQILSNEAYIGNLLQGKTKRCLYQGLDKQRVSKEEWIVHENAHEPIISKALFDEVRSVVDKKKEKKSFATREDLPLMADKYKGILKCSVCGEDMPRESAIIYSENGDVRQYYYRCRHGHLPIEEREGKSKVMISEEQQDLLVFASVQKAVKELAPDKKKLLITLEQSLQPVDTKLQERIADLKKQKERLEYEGSLSYGSYVKGEITREELQFTNEKQAEAVKNLEKKLLQAEKDYRSFLRQKKEKKQFVNALLSVKEKSVLTPELIRMLISEIILTPQRCMEIKYRFGIQRQDIRMYFSIREEPNGMKEAGVMSNLVMYLRLSLEDDMNADESNSITSQRRIIRDYISTHEELRSMNMMEKCDDGYSGTNMNRPGMQELLAMVKEQRVDCIIVKDMSQFARNYLETGKYIEQIFPFMGIRFIAINDNYDSKNFVGGVADIDVQFKSLLYDFYSKDLSQKVSTAVMARKDKGMFIGICAPFGYLKSKENACELLVDEEAAVIVKRIFTLRTGGESIAGIVRILNNEGIDTPASYHRRKGTYANMYTKGDSPLWTDYKVNSILNNEMYIGTFVYGKSRVKEVGSRRKQMLPQEEWKRIPNHHEALVSREMYEQVQAMKGKVPEAFTPRGKRASVYTGRVVCDCCGRNMIYHKDRLGKRFFNCEVNYRKKNNCVQRVLVTDLDSIIKGELSRHISGLAKLKILLDKEREQQNERICGAKQRLNMAENTLRRLELELRTAYESYVKGLTDKETYLMQKESYEVMISGIKEKIEAQKEAVFVLENQKPSDNSGLKFLEGNSEVAEITDELLDALLDSIVVYADKTIELRWKFSNRSN